MYHQALFYSVGFSVGTEQGCELFWADVFSPIDQLIQFTEIDELMISGRPILT
jgi:hypothetical protein